MLYITEDTLMRTITFNFFTISRNTEKGENSSENVNFFMYIIPESVPAPPPKWRKKAYSKTKRLVVSLF